MELLIIALLVMSFVIIVALAILIGMVSMIMKLVRQTLTGIGRIFNVL